MNEGLSEKGTGHLDSRDSKGPVLESKREMIREKDEATGEIVEKWTGDYIFECSNGRRAEVRKHPVEPEFSGRMEIKRRCGMTAIRATWTNGQIVPAEPVDWPEGSQLVVEPVPAGEKIGMTEEEWRDDPESIAEWIAWVDSIEPLVLTKEEEEEMERYRAEHRKFNIEAVRRQMQLEDQP